jgi:hypothetical protein
MVISVNKLRPYTLPGRILSQLIEVQKKKKNRGKENCDVSSQCVTFKKSMMIA